MNKYKSKDHEFVVHDVEDNTIVTYSSYNVKEANMDRENKAEFLWLRNNHFCGKVLDKDIRGVTWIRISNTVSLPAFRRSK